MTSPQARLTLSPLRNLMATATSLYAYRVRSTCPPGTRISSVRARQARSIHSPIAYTYTKDVDVPSGSRGFATTRVRFAKKGESREDLNPTSTEYSKSGGGDASAAHSEHAFDPNTTRPETEGEDDKTSSLNASPQNPEVNQTKDVENKAKSKSASEAGESERERTSSKSSPNKQGSRTVGT